jgi:hypothetical protein
VALCLEGRVADEELVAQNAERPNVHCFVVGLALNHLGGEVVERATEGVALGGRGVDGPAEVGDLDLALAIDEEVLRLDVTVDDVLLVAVVERRGEGSDVVRSSLLREALKALKVFVKLSSRGEFEDEIDSALIVEITIKAKNIVVTKVRLDLDFSTKLVLNAGLSELRLEQNFESNNVVTLLLPGQIDVSKFSAAQRLTNIEI